eukprot:313434-Amphidinium_carterae.1
MPCRDVQPPPSKRARTMTPPTPKGKGSGKRAFIDEGLSCSNWKGYCTPGYISGMCHPQRGQSCQTKGH